MGKRLIICCDGTWNTPDQKDKGVPSPSNVVKMAAAVSPTGKDGKTQVVFYDQGVGTGNWMDKLAGGLTGKGLTKNVEDAYRFLCYNYEPDDEIYCFGFSRGAYTARSVGGLIRKCGVVKKTHQDKISTAIRIYRKKDKTPDTNQAKTFRSNYSHQAKIKLIGVWDTVGALGVPIGAIRKYFIKPPVFHNVNLSRSVDHAYHALAIDEQRKHFKPSIWETKKSANQKVEQIWFAGVHTNIGGGYKNTGLSDLALKWMADKAVETGLTLDKAYLEKILHPKYDGVPRKSRKGLYRLIDTYNRPIGKAPNGEESVHESALLRLRQKIKGYAPKNLIEYLRRVKTEEGETP